MTTELHKARLKFRFPPGDQGKPMRDAVSAAFYSLRATIGTAEHPEVLGSPWDWRLSASAAFKLETDKLREHVRLRFAAPQSGEGVREQIERLRDIFGKLHMLDENSAAAPDQPAIDLKKDGPLAEIAA